MTSALTDGAARDLPDAPTPGDAKQSAILGGAMLPHGPQFFTLTDTGDKQTVRRVRARLAALAD
jgi:hypothetical protein